MNFKEFGLAILRGVFDSIKGIYWLIKLDWIQKNAHSDRTKFQELSRSSSSGGGGSASGAPNSISASRRRLSPAHRTHQSSSHEPRLITRVAQCCGLNGLVFGLSIILFKHVLLPFLQVTLSTIFGMTETTTTLWYWLQLILQSTFDSLWVLPLFILSRIVNALWFQDIGTLAYRYSVGRPKRIPSLSTFIADNLFSILIQALFLVQAMLTSLLPLPYLSMLIYQVHMCLLYSLYSFEYKWILMGWPLHQRLSFIETNWPYFLGFGLPLAIITNYSSDFLINGCLFAIVFPIFIISGNEGEPALYNGGKRLKLFSIVVSISNGLTFRQQQRQQRNHQQLNRNSGVKHQQQQQATTASRQVNHQLSSGATKLYQQQQQQQSRTN